jgi:Domain of unknown function (DUF4262)
MCVQCQARPVGEVLDGYRRSIRVRGWALASVPSAPGRVGFSYTIGLTRHHGHPELLASGLHPREADGLLTELAAGVRAGYRLRPGDVLRPDGGHRLQLVSVADPARLDHAQAIYRGWAGDVPALQVVWSDHDGHWPWHPGWPGRVSDQPLFGLPLHH